MFFAVTSRIACSGVVMRILLREVVKTWLALQGDEHVDCESMQCCFEMICWYVIIEWMPIFFFSVFVNKSVYILEI